jgi:hypothetical protein
MTRHGKLLGYCLFCFKEIYQGQKYLNDGVDLCHKNCLELYDPEDPRIEQDKIDNGNKR